MDMHPSTICRSQLVLTNLHAGEEIRKELYQVSGGLHGVGAKCVNAVSEWFVAEVRRDGNIHKMEFSRGKTTRTIEVVGSSKSTGTKITFMPDEQIFTETREFKFDVLAKRLRELAFLNPGVKIVLKDGKTIAATNFCLRDVSVKSCSTLIKTRTASSTNPFLFPEKHQRIRCGFIKLEVSLVTMIHSVTKFIPMPIPFTMWRVAHLSGFRTALTGSSIIAQAERYVERKGSFADWR